MIPAKGRKGLRSWIAAAVRGVVLDALFEQGLVRADVDDTPIPALTITTRDAGTILWTRSTDSTELVFQPSSDPLIYRRTHIYMVAATGPSAWRRG